MLVVTVCLHDIHLRRPKATTTQRIFCLLLIICPTNFSQAQRSFRGAVAEVEEQSNELAAAAGTSALQVDMEIWPFAGPVKKKAKKVR